MKEDLFEEAKELDFGTDIILSCFNIYKSESGPYKVAVLVKHPTLGEIFQFNSEGIEDILEFCQAYRGVNKKEGKLRICVGVESGNERRRHGDEEPSQRGVRQSIHASSFCHDELVGTLSERQSKTMGTHDGKLRI
ncbi:hypothetical protein FGB62_87g060 [Gracilaria domingensis]|nr:hypothetical protein FGB62_87g060 [Gracilaria domingensis]